MEYKKQKAFTLAEVLITVMVIGVLAVLTLPSLMQSLEKTVLKNQAKKVLSILSQALYEATAEEGDIQCYYGTSGVAGNWLGCPIFYSDNFSKKLRTIKSCSGTYTMNGCIPDYDLPADSSGACPNFEPKKSKKAYVLSDGTIVILYGPGQGPLFLVDVNGVRPPNKRGQDLLVFQIYKKITGEYYFGPSLSLCLSLPAYPVNNPIYFPNKSDLFK